MTFDLSLLRLPHLSPQVQASHILVKHRDSRRPSSWRTDKITRTKEEALEILEGRHVLSVTLFGGSVAVRCLPLLPQGIVIGLSTERSPSRNWPPRRVTAVVPAMEETWDPLDGGRCRVCVWDTHHDV